MGSLLSSMLKAIRRIFSWKICFFLRKKWKEDPNPLSIATDAVAVMPLWSQGQSVSPRSRSLGPQDCSQDRPQHPPVPSHPFPGTRTHPPPRCSRLWKARQSQSRLTLENTQPWCGRGWVVTPSSWGKSFLSSSAETLTTQEHLQSSCSSCI